MQTVENTPIRKFFLDIWWRVPHDTRVALCHLLGRHFRSWFGFKTVRLEHNATTEGGYCASCAVGRYEDGEEIYWIKK